MPPVTLRFILSACLACVTSLQGQQPRVARGSAVDTLSDMQVVPLTDGPNRVDLNGDGKPDLVWLAWRDNGNAHGSDVFTFMLSNPTRYYNDRPWLIIPVYDSIGKNERDSYNTSMGADCVLRDLRLLRSKNDPKAPVILVSGEREFGETYADVRPVTFVVYRLVYDSEAVGWPPFYFQASRTIRSRGKYCDVNDAFYRELGLGPYRDIN